MRVTFLLAGYPWKPYGGARVVYEYANALVEAGHEVSVVHPRSMPTDTLSHDGVTLSLRRRADRVRNVLLRPPITWQHIDSRVDLRWVRNLSAATVPDGDVVVATWWGTAEAVRDYPATKGLKAYLIQHYETWSGPDDRVDATWRSGLAMVVIAEWLYERGLELGADPASMQHVPNALDHERFRVLTPISERPLRIAMLASDMPWKGTREGIAALEIARAAVPQLEAVCFGTGSRPRQLPEWVAYRRNPDQELLVRDVYNGSAIYLCPSLTEGWGLPAFEAMACGCALVTADCGGVRDFAQHGRTALFAAPGDAHGLAQGIVRLAGDPAERLRLAEAGREAVRRFTWPRSARLMIEFFERRGAGRARLGQ
jgi:L-malate glycosyltransferase